ncbi:MAG: glycosyltransferase [Pseudomonadota bacterium]
MKPHLHIAILNVFFAPHTYGGATVVAEEVGRRLVKEHGVQVSAISVMSRGDLAPYSVIRGEVDGMATWLINLPPDRGYAESYINPYVGEQVARILHQIEPDIAHVHCVQDLGADCLSRIKAAGIPIVLSVHDFWWLCERQFMLRPDGSYCGQSPIEIEKCRGCASDFGRARARHSALLSLADLADVVTYPSVFAHDLCVASGLAPGKGVIWENGVRLPGEDFFERRAARRAADPRVVFGYVGGPSRIKGWPMIHDAFAGLGREDVKGLVVDGSLDGSWWKDIPLDGLSGSWAVWPRYDQDSMDAFYAEIDVLLFMSQWKETFGLSIREAVARGIQVIQTDSGGTVEHQAANPNTLLKIGDRPEILRYRVVDVLENGPYVQDPCAVTSQSDQAAAFMVLAEKVLAARDAGRSNDRRNGRSGPMIAA